MLYQQVEKLLQGGLSIEKDLSLVAVRKEDIFLQFISEAKISYRIENPNIISILYQMKKMYHSKRSKHRFLLRNTGVDSDFTQNF